MGLGWRTCALGWRRLARAGESRDRRRRPSAAFAVDAGRSVVRKGHPCPSDSLVAVVAARGDCSKNSTHAHLARRGKGGIC